MAVKRGTARQFANAVNKWTKETEERSTQAFQNGALDFYDALRANTPVDTGNMRDAWIASKNGNYKTGPTGPGFSGEEQSIATIMSLKLGDKVSYMNGATYFLRVERGFVGFDSLGRFYNQQGRWFARAVGARYRSIMRAAATRLRLASK